MARCRCRKPTRSRERRLLPDLPPDEGRRVTPDSSALVVRTADVTQDSDHGYDTYFSLPSDFPSSSVPAAGDGSPLSSPTGRYQPRVRLSLPTAYRMKALSSSGEPSDTYFSPPATGIASND